MEFKLEESGEKQHIVEAYRSLPAEEQTEETSKEAVPAKEPNEPIEQLPKRSLPEDNDNIECDVTSQSPRKKIRIDTREEENLDQAELEGGKRVKVDQLEQPAVETGTGIHVGKLEQPSEEDAASNGAPQLQQTSGESEHVVSNSACAPKDGELQCAQESTPSVDAQISQSHDSVSVCDEQKGTALDIKSSDPSLPDSQSDDHSASAKSPSSDSASDQYISKEDTTGVSSTQSSGATVTKCESPETQRDLAESESKQAPEESSGGPATQLLKEKPEQSITTATSTEKNDKDKPMDVDT